jgi:hypothetical protein
MTFITADRGEVDVNIRHYQPGDEAAQVAIFNVAAAGLPKFKPATLVEVQRRVRARDFDPSSRLYVEVGGEVVGYGTINKNGRVSYPWCLPGHESHREPLFEAMLAAMRARQAKAAFAAYRKDWVPVGEFFSRRGFVLTREMVNFFINFFDMPTPSAVLTAAITPLEPSEVPAAFALAPEAVRTKTPAELEQHLLRNPYFPPESVFALRSKIDRRILAVGIFIRNNAYADPEVIDPLAPCFRLGAFGAEGMDTKRVNGLFSFIAKDDRSLSGYGLELMGEAAGRVVDGDTCNGLAAQASSDAPALLGFYQRFFRRQGSFPIYERAL